MLLELKICNFVLIDEVHLEFDKGFSVITGETGAGKSLFIKALKLILGERGSPQLIKPGRSEAEIEAIIWGGTYLAKKLEELGLPPDEEIHIRRTISPNRQKTFVNGSPITLTELSRLTQELISLTSQHEQYTLFNRDNQLLFLDTFLNLTERLQNYRALYKKYRDLSNECEALIRKRNELEQRREFLLFQLRELEELNPDPQEELELQTLRDRIRNLNFLKENLKALEECLQSVDENLYRALSYLRKISPIESSLGERERMLELQAFDVRELLREVQGLLSGLPEDERGLEEIESRLARYEKLKKKYKTDTEGLTKLREELKVALSGSESFDFELERIQKQLKDLEKELLMLAEEISEKRAQGSRVFAEALVQELKDLALERAEIKINLLRREAKVENLTNSGLDELEILFSSNPGLPPRPLEKIASGGELSRLFLAIKTVLKEDRGPATLVFDEIDTGIGGITATMVGQKLKALSEKSQIICITHLPQIAKFADHHYLVEKLIEGNSTTTVIRRLDDKSRAKELARMSGHQEY